MLLGVPNSNSTQSIMSAESEVQFLLFCCCVGTLVVKKAWWSKFAHYHSTCCSDWNYSKPTLSSKALNRFRL